MKVYPWLKISVLAFMILAITALTPPAEVVLARDRLPGEDQELIQTFAPVLYFHPAELFRPQSVDVMVNTARLRQARRNWFDVNVLPHISISALFDYHDDSYALDAWYGDDGHHDRWWFGDVNDYGFRSGRRKWYAAVNGG